MDEPNDNDNARLEGLLRRWGAERAAGEASVPPAPVATRPKRSRWWTVIHYASVAAAAGILVAAGVLHYAPRWAGQPHEPPAARQRGDSADLAALQGEMTQTREALIEAEAARAAADEELQAARNRDQEAQSRLAFLTRAAKIDAKAKEQLAGELAAAEMKAGEARAALALAAERMAGAEKELPALQRDREAALRELARARERQNELAGELARVQKMYQGALAMRAARPATPAPMPSLVAAPGAPPAAPAAPAAEARQQRALADMQRVYLRAMAPGLSGLAARREAAKRARMLERVREIRPLAQSAPARELLDRLEVTFTRLALLNPARPESERSLTKLVAEGRLIVRIDDVLAGVGEAPATRTWLLEARLILQGADRVG